MPQTKDTMVDVPEGARPEEYLSDVDLAGFYERQLRRLDAEDPANPERPFLIQKVRAARIAAAIVSPIE
jgi:hypothetical protein